MEKFMTWVYIAVAVAIALGANTISTIWAKGDTTFSIWLLALVIISPVVFITFGLVTARTGLVVSSGTIDSLLTITTMTLALVAFREWSMLSPCKIAGIVCTVSGIVLLHVEA